MIDRGSAGADQYQMFRCGRVKVELKGAEVKKDRRIDNMKKIYCPYCKMRLFDARDGGKAEIDIKCVRCGRIVRIDLKETTLKTASG